MRRARGFTLIEVVIASGLLIALSIGAALLLTLTLDTIAHSRQRAQALVLARSKLEEVLSLRWSARDLDGVLLLSSDASLIAPGAGDDDYLDAQGQWIASGTAGGIPASACYARRWVIARSGSGASELLIVQVMVTTAKSARGGTDAFERGDRDAVWISGARLRRGL